MFLSQGIADKVGLAGNMAENTRARTYTAVGPFPISFFPLSRQQMSSI